MLTRSGRHSIERSDGSGARRRPMMHLHWFRRVGDDPFSGASLYACSCGVVRPGF